jgi:hypothetical protein
VERANWENSEMVAVDMNEPIGGCSGMTIPPT